MKNSAALVFHHARRFRSNS